VDNFCWPNIQYDPIKNPDGRFKAGQLVRSCRALKDICMAYAIPLLSGKDSMYVDGNLPGRYGVSHKVSAPETMQFSTISLVPDVTCCQSMEIKQAGDLIYLLGLTHNELGASEYYAHLGYVGLNVPQVRTEASLPLYQALTGAIAQRQTASVHGVYRGGLGVHAALVAMGSHLGLTLRLADVPMASTMRDDAILFSESTGRFLVTVSPDRQKAFEAQFAGLPCACVGEVTASPRLVIKGGDGGQIVDTAVDALRTAWKSTYGDLI